MTNTTLIHLPEGGHSNNSEVLTMPLSPNTVACNVNNTSTPAFTHPQPSQASECASSPTTVGNPLSALQRYLDEAPKDGGPTCGLRYGSEHQDILNILALVDFEFGEGKTPH